MVKRPGKKQEQIEVKLLAFAEKHKMKGKGSLSVALVITRKVKDKRTPFKEADFLSPAKGQVAGLSRNAVQTILADHGIPRVLAEEGGRTSRGSLRRMREYVSFLNSLAAADLLDLPFIESWWVQRVKEYFASQPLRLKLDPSKSLRHIMQDLIKAAWQRQADCPGTMVAGAVAQHLVGAKLELALPDYAIEHEGAAVADGPSRRRGDFLIHDAVVHVTMMPTEALIRKCQDNLAAGLRPIIVVPDEKVRVAQGLADHAGVADRIDVLEIEQFLATNVYEWCRFAQDGRRNSVKEQINRYNEIVEACETDVSLKVAIE